MPASTNATPQAEAGQQTQPANKKRGGQPGNTNALKHGFYTKNFSLAERRGLQAVEGVVLGDEIKLLRVLIRRFAEQIQGSQDVSLNESAQHLAVISEAMLRLASLLRTDNMLGGSEYDTIGASLSRAMNSVLEEMRNDAG